MLHAIQCMFTLFSNVMQGNLFIKMVHTYAIYLLNVMCVLCLSSYVPMYFLVEVYCLSKIFCQGVQNK